MTTEKLYDLTDLRSKLRAKTGPKPLDVYARILSEYLNDEVVLDGLIMGVLLLIGDLQRGSSGFSGQDLPPTLLGQPPMFYGMLESATKLLIREHADKELADAFRDAWDKQIRA
jgi:hypothetical protein